jgi:hypothetical protein
LESDWERILESKRFSYGLKKANDFKFEITLSLFAAPVDYFRFFTNDE